MKTPGYIIIYISLAVLSACAGRPSLRTETIPLDSVSLPASQEEKLSSLEKMINRVKRNGVDIPKYFVRENDGIVTVKANMEGYEITYDLMGSSDGRPGVSPPGGIPVKFTIEEEDTGFLGEDQFLWQPEPGDAGILLAFDDAYMETWEKYLALFDKYGARVTFFIQGEFTPFCHKALGRGHDIGFHTVNHPDLRKLSREKIIEESVFPSAAFRAQEVSLTSFAYPFGFYEPWIHTLLLKHYSLLRGYGTTYRIYSRDEIRAGFVIARAIDNTVIKGDENFDSSITMMLRTVKFIGRDYVFPITTHDISDEAAWGITPRRLEFLLKSVSDLKLKFYRYCDF